ncbi:MAG: Mth938-like domain-containing protein [Candidatus Macondimonas sp.]
MGIEVMDTGAACRTFNVLLAEDRAVVALLLLGEA